MTHVQSIQCNIVDESKRLETTQINIKGRPINRIFCSFKTKEDTPSTDTGLQDNIITGRKNQGVENNGQNRLSFTFKKRKINHSNWYLLYF